MQDLDHTVLEVLKEQIQLVSWIIICSIIQFFQHTAPDNSPQNVTATAVSSTEFKVLWEEIAAIDENGVITMYEIQYAPLETFEGRISTDVCYTSNGAILMFTLNGLEEYVYRI